MNVRPGIKFYAALKDRKARLETGLFMVEGHKVIGEGLKSPCECEAIFVRKGFSSRDKATQEIMDSSFAEVLDDDDFNKLSRTENPQGILGVFHYRNLLVDTLKANKVVVLYDIADPRNVGTIIRCGDWFGLREFLVGEDCVDMFNEKVIRSSTGSIFHCRFKISEDLLDDLDDLHTSHKILTADLGGADYRNLPTYEKAAYIFSNEARGPSDAILNRTDQVITIPGAGRAESLSVASAAAIFMSRIA